MKTTVHCIIINNNNCCCCCWCYYLVIIKYNIKMLVYLYFTFLIMLFLFIIKLLNYLVYLWIVFSNEYVLKGSFCPILGTYWTQSSDVTYDQVWWPILRICALHLTHPRCTHTPWTHTHREHTPGAVDSHLCCGARGAVGGSVPWSRAPQSWYWRWRERANYSLPPPTIPAGPRLELTTFRLRVRVSNH